VGVALGGPPVSGPAWSRAGLLFSAGQNVKQCGRDWGAGVEPEPVGDGVDTVAAQDDGVDAMGQRDLVELQRAATTGRAVAKGRLHSRPPISKNFFRPAVEDGAKKKSN